MTKFLTAIALTIAIPAAASAHPASAPAAKKMECCEKMKKKCACCKDMAKMDHGSKGTNAAADPHAGHDMSGAKAPAADPQPNN